MSFSEFFHHLSKSHAGRSGFITPDAREWPREWKTIYFKTYLDFEKIVLPTPPALEATLSDAIAKRASSRIFKQRPLPLSHISALMKYSCGLQSEVRQEDTGHGPIAWHHRAQPSGGGRFPIETYLFNFVAGELPTGVFHYDVKNHVLSVLEKRAFEPSDIAELFTYEYVRRASCAIVLTAVFERTAMKYGERGYRYVLLEAGHIGQNVSLVSSALHLGAVMMGGTCDEQIERLLDVDGITESVVYGMVIG